MVQIGFKSNKGIRRENNEDSYFLLPMEEIYIVADGVGGNSGGEIASRSTVASIAEYIRNNPISKRSKDAELKDYFMKCMSVANEKIYMLAGTEGQNAGMATTALLAYLDNKYAYIVNVGDSRAYICRDEKLSCVTEDHTYVNALLKEGLITYDEAKAHPQKHMITRAIGGDETVEPDFFKIELKEKDILLLCTDGLYSEVPEEKIVKILTQGCNMQSVAASLVDEANNNGGRDNITVICLRI